jgi:hypothetical protein
MKWYCILSKAFSASIEMIKWLFVFVFIIGLHMLNHPCIPGMKPTWSWCVIFLICCWIQFAFILLRIFASMFIKEFFLDASLSCFGMGVILAS